MPPEPSREIDSFASDIETSSNFYAGRANTLSKRIAKEEVKERSSRLISSHFLHSTICVSIQPKAPRNPPSFSYRRFLARNKSTLFNRCYRINIISHSVVAVRYAAMVAP
eukprot:scaffold24029_cov144-Skeletonema_dohrnii-CCMP3373.AAC.14